MKHPITQLLTQARQGNLAATEALFNAVYTELKLLARANRRRWQGNHTLNTTALIHEAYVKLAAGEPAEFANRTHFYATASRAMRQILINYAERQRAAKRGGDAVQVNLDDAVLATETSADELLHIDQLLKGLEADHPRRCRIIECRVFGGMTVDEVAQALDISPATVKREWRLGTASLYQTMQAATAPDDAD